MRDNEALFQTILENPDDDAPRLVYADWLEEHGDSARAEFIRVQCQMAVLNEANRNQPQWENLKLREKELLAAHGVAWALPLAHLVRSSEFARGFIDRITVDATTFLRGADTLFRFGPIQHVHLLEAARWLHRLACCKHLARVRGLGLSGNSLTDFQVNLIRTPYLRRLRELHLDRNHITDLGARILASYSSPDLPDLSILNLSHNFIGDEGAIALARSNLLAKIRQLDVSHNYIGMGPLYVLQERFGDRVTSSGQNHDSHRQRIEALITRYPDTP